MIALATTDRVRDASPIAWSISPDDATLVEVTDGLVEAALRLEMLAGIRIKADATSTPSAA
jgi:hypothetical protein